jgi:CRP-like cAMP-binding protein
MNFMNYKELERLQLFRGLTPTEIRCVCDCFGAQVRTYKKGALIFRRNEPQKHFGVIVGGVPSANGEGEYLGEILGAGGICLATVTSPEDKFAVLLVPFRKLTRSCSNACTAHAKLTANFLAAISAQVTALHERLNCLCQPNTRAKALAFLEAKMRETSCELCREFDIGVDRTSMAEYLSVQHSALSRELSKMQDDGIITFNRNMFQILK